MLNNNTQSSAQRVKALGFGGAKGRRTLTDWLGKKVHEHTFNRRTRRALKHANGTVKVGW